jgi:ribosomal protein S18 acetylase RimI-like enzyme
MRHILSAGRAAGGPAYYVHPGDLNWWLFCTDIHPDFRERTYLWETSSGDAIGWGFFSLIYLSFDVFAHPAVSPEQRLAMFDWAEGHLADLMRGHGGDNLHTFWISEHDRSAIDHLHARGFRRSDDGMLHLERDLDDLAMAPSVPPGFAIRPLAGEAEMNRRARASHAAFASRGPVHEHMARYRHFLHAPVYDPDLNLVVAAPDGQIAAFATCWLDGTNREGHLEPVGTHPAFRRRGLGRSVVWAGLQAMAARGMASATVCVERDNAAARGLYDALGFRPLHELWTFKKDLV